MKKYKNQMATEEKLNELHNQTQVLSQEIKSEKNKKKKDSVYNIPLLEEQCKSYGEQYDDLRVKLISFNIQS